MWWNLRSVGLGKLVVYLLSVILQNEVVFCSSWTDFPADSSLLTTHATHHHYGHGQRYGQQPQPHSAQLVALARDLNLNISSFLQPSTPRTTGATFPNSQPSSLQHSIQQSHGFTIVDNAQGGGIHRYGAEGRELQELGYLSPPDYFSGGTLDHGHGVEVDGVCVGSLGLSRPLETGQAFRMNDEAMGRGRMGNRRKRREAVKEAGGSSSSPSSPLPPAPLSVVSQLKDTLMEAALATIYSRTRALPPPTNLIPQIVGVTPYYTQHPQGYYQYETAASEYSPHFAFHPAQQYPAAQYAHQYAAPYYQQQPLLPLEIKPTQPPFMPVAEMSMSMPVTMETTTPRPRPLQRIRQFVGGSVTRAQAAFAQINSNLGAFTRFAMSSQMIQRDPDLRDRVILNPSGVTCFEACSPKGTRYALVGICTKNYCKCDDGRREHSCSTGHVFDPVTLTCRDPRWTELCSDRTTANGSSFVAPAQQQHPPVYGDGGAWPMRAAVAPQPAITHMTLQPPQTIQPMVMMQQPPLSPAAAFGNALGSSLAASRYTGGTRDFHVLGGREWKNPRLCLFCYVHSSGSGSSGQDLVR